MTCIESVLEVFVREDVDPSAYGMGGEKRDEQYCLERSGREYLVYYAERGLQTGLRVFGAEDEACAYFEQLVLRDPTTRRKHQSVPAIE